MKKAPGKTSKKQKGNPIPIRFDEHEESTLADIATATGLGKAEIIRRAARYALPKFLNREINILDVVAEIEVPA
jgi:hypothetical protein